RYAFDTWPESAARQGLTLDKIVFPGFERAAIDFSPDLPITLDFNDAKGVTRFILELRVANDPAAAKEALVRHLTYLTSLREAPSTQDEGIKAGDIGYIGYSIDARISWIAFVRGNIFARLSCLDPRRDPHPDMRNLAEDLDRLIQAEPIVEGEAKISRPSIEQPRIDDSGLRAGQNRIIDLKINDAKESNPAAVSWIIGGPGQGYVEKDEQGRWRLYTTRGGSIELSCHVLSAKGFAVSKRISILVE
ncbi:MAG: hypothetical protein KJ645_14850, partial [Planctomycetes bacterium]|nr:hypothetical protein [Planctomycetota bacterium]